MRNVLYLLFILITCSLMASESKETEENYEQQATSCFSCFGCCKKQKYPYLKKWITSAIKEGDSLIANNDPLITEIDKEQLQHLKLAQRLLPIIEKERIFIPLLKQAEDLAQTKQFRSRSLLAQNYHMQQILYTKPIRDILVIYQSQPNMSGKKFFTNLKSQVSKKSLSSRNKTEISR